MLWDWRIRTLIDSFSEHDGPVRGIAFHHSQPLFVSGGDDYKIKVWNYKQRRCLFTLLGHLDYIRTVAFHHESPWILSASDDQTIRIWNWQNRQSVAVLTGHNHYVMCAQFHPKEDLVVSASLDQTVRVWDISGLRKKSISNQPDNPMQAPQNDLFGNTEAVVKYVLEGHDRGVNWAAFHPTLPLIVSGADDRQLKLWRTSESKAWEVDTFRGHFNNVSCCLFHPRQELILSDSEDRTIRVWDVQKRLCLATFRRDTDRFWILAAHPTLNVFAAGHDSGLVLFKLERERPAYTLHQNTLFFVKDRAVHALDLAAGRDTVVFLLRPRSSPLSQYRTIHYNAAENSMLLVSDGDVRQYELYTIPKGGTDSPEPRRGNATTAVFVARNRFAVLEKGSGIRILDTATGEMKKLVQLQGVTGNVEAMFHTPTVGCLLLRADDKLILYDVQTNRSLGELTTPAIKFAVWSSNGQYVALLGKETLVICNRQLEQLATLHETMRVKSAVWDENNVLIYNTATHLKFSLPNGDSGIVRTLDVALYLCHMRGNKVFALDREGRVRGLAIDNTEYMFKLALVKRKYADVLRFVKEANLMGQAIISYLQKKGFPDVALHFVKDEKMRFNLALECGNIEVALQSARVVDERECWHRLGVEALRQGNHQTVEMAYQQTKNFERLSFLYLITGNTFKLERMLKIAEMRQDVMSRFHNALYLGDVAERVKILEETGQLQLAYACATLHGLTEQADALKAKLGDAATTVLPANAQLLSPPQPVLTSNDMNWPLLNVQKPYFEGGGRSLDDKLFASPDEVAPADAGAWGGMALDLKVGDEAGAGGEEDPLGLHEAAPAAGASAGDGGAPTWGIQLDDLEGLDTVETHARAAGAEYRAAPVPAPPPTQAWARSRLAADHVAAGSLESAMQLLNQQAGVVSFEPFKSLFQQLYTGARAFLPAMSGLAPVPVYLQRELPSGPARGGLPLVVTGYGLASLIERLKAAYQQTSRAPSMEAINMFHSILISVPLLVLDDKKEIDEAKQLIELCREYINGLRMELKRQELFKANAEPSRQLELAAYFTHCNLQMVHLMLALQVAMVTAHKLKNFDHAGSFARRLLELNPKPEVATQAKKVALFAEKNTGNAVSLRYDERNPFVVCAISFTPIYKGSPAVVCPLCGSSYVPEHTGKVCACCRVAQIGKSASGLVLSSVVRQ